MEIKSVLNEKYCVCKPSVEDKENLKKLFFDYPYKSFQQKFQGLKKEILSEFFAEAFVKSSSAKDTNNIIIKNDENIFAIGGIAYNDWHTQNFGMRMGRISNFVLSEKTDFNPSILLNILLDYAKKINLKHIACRFDADDWKNIHLLESAGFYLVDCSVKFGIKLPSKIQPDEKNMIQIVPYAEQYLDRIMEIAATSHQTNHFYADPNLPKEKTNQLFANWVKRLANGNAKSIYVVLKESFCIGFIIFLENKIFNQQLGVKIAILDYVVLDSKLQGQGLGTELLASTIKLLEKDYDHIELRTSHNNYPAVNLYQKIGFKLISTDIVLHKIIS